MDGPEKIGQLQRVTVLVDYICTIYKRAGVLYQHIKTRREAECFRC